MWTPRPKCSQAHIGPTLYFLPPFHMLSTRVYGESSGPHFAEEALNDCVKATQIAPGSGVQLLPSHQLHVKRRKTHGRRQAAGGGTEMSTKKVISHKGFHQKGPSYREHLPVIAIGRRLGRRPPSTSLKTAERAAVEGFRAAVAAGSCSQTWPAHGSLQAELRPRLHSQPRIDHCPLNPRHPSK